MISVCIPTYNGEKYIRKQLESILSQLSYNDEIIISDDSSTDNTIQIVEKLNDPRIKIFKNNKFKSPIFNLENAIVNSKGDFIFLSDQDDIWKPLKVNTILKFLDSGYSLVVSDCEIIDHEDKVVEKSFFRLKNSGPGFFKNFYRNSYLGCCMAMNRQSIDYILPFPKNIAMHDIWIGLISELKGKVLFIDDQLISYRRHFGNFSQTAGKSEFNFLYKVKYRYQMLISISKRIVGF